MILLLALLLVLLFFGLGFTAHFLWIVAVVLLRSVARRVGSGAWRVCRASRFLPMVMRRLWEPRFPGEISIS